MKITKKYTPHVAVGSVVVIIVCLAVIFGSYSGPDVSGEIERFVEVARLSAEETAAFLGPGRRVVLAVYGPTRSTALLKQDEAFRKTLEYAKITVVAVETRWDAESHTPPGSGGSSFTLPVEQFVEIAETHPGADAIVSLTGALQGPTTVLDDLPPSAPPLIVARANLQAGITRNLFESGIMSMAIVPRFQPLEEPREDSDSSRAAFERSYQVITAENADALTY